MTKARRCRVSVRTADGVSHAIEVTGTSLFEVAAAALAQLRDEGWSSLPPDGVLRVEVQLPPIVHEVPLKALQRWAREPSVSPKQKLLQEAVGDRSSRRSGR
jgi:hypothetical protein